MSAPIVTRQHLERAWLEASGAATVLAPAKWDAAIVGEFVREVPTVASVMIAAAATRFRRRERAAVAQWIAAWLHRGYKLAGAQCAPLTKDELVDLLAAEQAHLVRISRMAPAQIAAAEEARMREIPNGHLLDMLMQVWGRACDQVPQQGEDPSLLAQDTYFARLHLAVILAALNASADRHS
jgi:hypothetical protein